MEKSTLKVLKALEKIFPQDMVSGANNFNYMGTFNIKAIGILVKNKLVEEVPYSVNPKGIVPDDKAIVWRITSLGIEFLNGIRQKRTNTLLLIATILLFLIGVIQLIK